MLVFTILFQSFYVRMSCHSSQDTHTVLIRSLTRPPCTSALVGFFWCQLTLSREICCPMSPGIRSLSRFLFHLSFAHFFLHFVYAMSSILSSSPIVSCRIFDHFWVGSRRARMFWSVTHVYLPFPNKHVVREVCCLTQSEWELWSEWVSYRNEYTLYTQRSSSNDYVRSTRTTENGSTCLPADTLP